MNSKEERLNNILHSNVPFYKQSDLTPPKAGKSLLHDDNGKPNFKSNTPNVLNDIKNTLDKLERVKVKGGITQNPIINSNLMKRELNPRHSLKQSELENNTPNTPNTVNMLTNSVETSESLPVHVGNHEDHRWYDGNVTGTKGTSNPNENQFYNGNITGGKNNATTEKYVSSDYINIDKLQGLNPLSPETKFFTDEDDLSQDVYENAYEDESNYNEQHNIKVNDSTNESEENFLNLCKEGQMCIFVDGNYVFTSSTLDGAKECIEDIILNYNIDKSRVSVFKKLSVNFGITVS